MVRRVRRRRDGHGALQAHARRERAVHLGGEHRAQRHLFAGVGRQGVAVDRLGLVPAPLPVEQQAADLRNDVRGGFRFGDVFWEEYRGQVGAQKFIADGEAYLIPEGVSDLFVTHYAPADYMETVNTIGLPYYAKQEVMDFNKGIMVETQSNPISLCTRPRAVVKLTVA